MIRIGKVLPNNIIADTLSAHETRVERVNLREGIRFHVSDVIAYGDRRFCSREKVLLSMDSTPRFVGSLSPGMSLLFKSGDFIHDLVRDSFIHKSESYGGYVYGDWRCSSCGSIVHRNKCYSSIKGSESKCCKATLNYSEIHLELPDYALTGHPDLLMKVGGIYHIYEIKSVYENTLGGKSSGQVMPFNTIKEPSPAHILQATMYYWMMRSVGMKVSKKLRILYVNRGNSTLFRSRPYLEFSVYRYDRSRVEPFFKSCKNTLSFIENGTLPDRICKTHSCARAKGCVKRVECFLL